MDTETEKKLADLASRPQISRKVSQEKTEECPVWDAYQSMWIESDGSLRKRLKGVEVCAHCKAEIPAGACQQGQKIQGDWYPLHVGCAEPWANEMIDVWTIEYDDFGHTTNCFEDVKGELSELEPDQAIEVKPWKMPRIEFLNLPEGEP